MLLLITSGSRLDCTQLLILRICKMIYDSYTYNVYGSFDMKYRGMFVERLVIICLAPNSRAQSPCAESKVRLEEQKNRRDSRVGEKINI